MSKHLFTSLPLVIISLTIAPLFAAEEPIKATVENVAPVKEAATTEATVAADEIATDAKPVVAETAADTETEVNEETVVNVDTGTVTEEAEANGEAAAEAEVAEAEPVTIMDLPVNFSTPQEVEKSMQAIEEQAGIGKVKAVKAAMGYILAYDLGLRHDKDKMYKKLNGKTPNQIIARVKR